MGKSHKHIWLQKLSEGNEEAYRLFFDEYYQILGMFAFKYVRQKEIAEDIVNDVILELYSRKEHFDSLITLKSYLFVAIKNRCLNFLRDDKVKSRYLQITLPAADDGFFLDNIIEEEIYFLLKQSINVLPEIPYKVFELSMQGFTNEEIAEKLSLTVDSVKAHKKRGKKILKIRLKGLMCFLSISF